MSKYIACFLLLGTVSPTAHAAGVVSTCNEASLSAALAGGGTVTFSCSGTIVITGTMSLSSMTIIDGTGQSVIISGNNTIRLFNVMFEVSATFNNLTLTGGSTPGSGGAILNLGTTIITNTTFSGNAATSSNGGAIFNVGTLVITSTTFSGNFADNGGAIYNASGAENISDSTFFGNAAIAGSAIYNNGGTLNISNSILSSTSGGECFGTITDGGYNLAKDTTCGFTATGSVQNVTAQQLNLGTLASNGGSTQTILPGFASIALDAIPVGANCEPTSQFDQRGIARPQHSKCDIGAVEITYRLPPRLISE